MTTPIHILSLGAGVQSSTMALMAAAGEIQPMPTCAIFADTKAEPKQVYDWLDWLEEQLPFPVCRVCEKDGLTKAIEGGALEKKRAANPPLFTLSANGSKGILSRDCTLEFKVKPIIAKTRELVGLAKGRRCKRKLVVQWIGISLDEVQRMKPSRMAWIEHRWPLIDARMSRHDCLRWMESRGYPMPPRSACVYCPYHSNHEWRRVKQDADAWREAERVDELVRNGIRGTTDKLFVHKTCTPLAEVDLSTEEERGQGNLFNNECEGMCGV